MAFVLDKKEDMQIIYDMAKKVHDRQLTADTAATMLADKTQASIASLKMYFNIYSAMRCGRCYKHGTSASFTEFLLNQIYLDFGEEELIIAIKAAKLHSEYRVSVNNEQPGISIVCRKVIETNNVNIEYDSLPAYQEKEVGAALSDKEKVLLLEAINKPNAEFSSIIMKLSEQYQVFSDSDLELLCDRRKSRELFSCDYSYFKRIDSHTPLDEQIKSTDGRNRYYNTVYILNGNSYVMTSQLYGYGGNSSHRNNRKQFYDWVLSKFELNVPSSNNHMPGTFDSWEIIDETTAIKTCDKSFFEYNGSGVPKEICWFFEADELSAGETHELKLIYDGKEYAGKVTNDTTDRRRVRIFWNTYLGNIFRSYKDQNAVAVFEKLNNDTYRVTLKGGEKEMTTKEQISAVKAYIAARGFHYDGTLIENFYLGLKSKPFVILAGTSGTGKTRLVRLFAESIHAEYKLVSVRPDWSDSSDLFGHVDLNQRFVPGAIIDFVKQAELNPTKPYFLCLDEMNLARVEYYMSDILSAIETRRYENGMIVTDPVVSSANYGNDASAAGRYGKVILPGNLYIVGTVNMDETTFPFSKKVLDRANTIEFSYVDLLAMPFFSTASAEKISVPNEFLASKYVTLNDCDAADRDYIGSICTALSRINNILQTANAHIGYRVRDEIVFYMLNNREAELLEEKTAFDNQIMQKILPRIQGSSESIKTMLEELLKICESEKYEASAHKIKFMIKRYEEDGFTSYWL